MPLSRRKIPSVTTCMKIINENSNSKHLTNSQRRLFNKLYEESNSVSLHSMLQFTVCQRDAKHWSSVQRLHFYTMCRSSGLRERMETIHVSLILTKMYHMKYCVLVNFVQVRRPYSNARTRTKSLQWINVKLERPFKL